MTDKVLLQLTEEQVKALEPLLVQMREQYRITGKAGMLFGQPLQDGNPTMPVKLFSPDETLKIVEAANMAEVNRKLGLID